MIRLLARAIDWAFAKTCGDLDRAQARVVELESLLRAKREHLTAVCVDLEQSRKLAATYRAQMQEASKRADEAEVRNLVEWDRYVTANTSYLNQRLCEAQQLYCDTKDALERERARREAAERDYAACAHAIGIEYVQDTGPSYPGPVEVVVASIEKARRDADAVEEIRAALSRARPVLEAALAWRNRRYEQTEQQALIEAVDRYEGAEK